ncbi:ATP-binding protein [Microcoleus sp. B3-D7]|uniref:ATP-binding protein n=1 Tax=Microcoleus sp. B3-D7 TaxID=2818659 RepID=UPI002FD03093
MSSKVTIGSFVGAFCCLGLALVPIPFDRWVGLRQASSVAAVGCGYFGWRDSQKKKELLEQQELWQFQQRQKQQAIEAAMNNAVADVLVQEVVVKEQMRANASVEVYKAQTQQNYVTVMNRDHPEILNQLLKNSETSETKTDSASAPETKPDSVTNSVSDSGSGNEQPREDTKTPAEIRAEQMAAARAVLLKLIEEHEGGWIGQLMKKPVLIYGDQGSYKSYFAAFLALCRYYLRGHSIVSIADPHFHQNKNKCWKYLVELGVPGYGANYDYEAIGAQLNAMYDRFAVRTEEDNPITSIFDEATNYGLEEGSKESASKLSRKVISDPRKSNESPVIIAHNNTNAAWGGGTGFSDSLQGNVIQIKLYSTSEQTPVFRGVISGIKDEEGEFIKDYKISILANWIRPEFVYNLFNPPISEKTPVSPTFTSIPTASNTSGNTPINEKTNNDTNRSNNKEHFMQEAANWLADVNGQVNGQVNGEVREIVKEAEVNFTTQTLQTGEGNKITLEVPEVHDSNTSSFTSALSEDERSKALVAVLQLLSEAKISSSEVISLMPENPDKALWLGIKLLNKSMTAIIRDVLDCGTGGKKFQRGKTLYEGLKQQFGNYK